jgi:uroporphyrinogen-III synthase
LSAALSRCDVAAISQNAAAPLADTPVNRVVVANSPDEDALLDALDTLASPAAR